MAPALSTSMVSAGRRAQGSRDMPFLGGLRWVFHDFCFLFHFSSYLFVYLFCFPSYLFIYLSLYRFCFRETLLS